MAGKNATQCGERLGGFEKNCQPAIRMCSEDYSQQCEIIRNGISPDPDPERESPERDQKLATAAGRPASLVVVALCPEWLVALGTKGKIYKNQRYWNIWCVLFCKRKIVIDDVSQSCTEKCNKGIPEIMRPLWIITQFRIDFWVVSSISIQIRIHVYHQSKLSKL